MRRREKLSITDIFLYIGAILYGIGPLLFLVSLIIPQEIGGIFFAQLMAGWVTAAILVSLFGFLIGAYLGNRAILSLSMALGLFAYSNAAWGMQLRIATVEGDLLTLPCHAPNQIVGEPRELVVLARAPLKSDVRLDYTISIGGITLLDDTKFIELGPRWKEILKSNITSQGTLRARLILLDIGDGQIKATLSGDLAEIKENGVVCLEGYVYATSEDIFSWVMKVFAGLLAAVGLFASFTEAYSRVRGKEKLEAWEMVVLAILALIGAALLGMR